MAFTPERVRTWHAAVTSRAGIDQAAKSYRLLRAVLVTAATDDLIARNPCTIRGGGIERARERPLLEISTVFALAAAIEPRLRSLVLVAGFGSLRSGELLGLQRRDVDLLHGAVHVERQAQEVTGQGRVLTRPKSDAGRRIVALPAEVVGELRGHIDTYVAPHVDAAVFTRPSGLPLRRQDLSRAWAAACTQVGLSGVRVHDLRHFGATLTARDPNVTLKELMARIGHSTPVAALRYQHAAAERDQQHAEYLQSVILEARRSGGVGAGSEPGCLSRGV